MSLTLLHTSPAHRAQFDALRDRLAPGLDMVQDVREAWLAEAQDGVSSALEQEITQSISAVGGAVLCTCTTIGPIAERAGALRIDRPMMAEAARIGGPVLMAYCLDSTRAPSLALLEEEVAGRDVEVQTLPLTGLWPLFEAGRLEEFASEIAAAIRDAKPKAGCVVLAQASMAEAAALLGDLGVPVLASPELAFRAALARI